MQFAAGHCQTALARAGARNSILSWTAYAPSRNAAVRGHQITLDALAPARPRVLARWLAHRTRRAVPGACTRRRGARGSGRGERGGSLLSRLETRVRRLAWTEGEPKRELPRRGLQRARHAIAHTRVLFDGSARGDARRDKGACWNWHGVPRRATALLQTRTTLGPIGHSPKGREAAAM